MSSTPAVDGSVQASQPGASPSATALARSKPKLLELVREAIAVRHYSDRTYEAYAHWIKRFIVFHGMRHPAELSAGEVTRFLSHLAVRKQVSASTQNQAFNALLFLYKLRGAPRKRNYVLWHVTLSASRKPAHRLPAAL